MRTIRKATLGSAALIISVMAMMGCGEKPSKNGQHVTGPLTVSQLVGYINQYAAQRATQNYQLSVTGKVEAGSYTLSGFHNADGDNYSQFVGPTGAVQWEAYLVGTTLRTLHYQEQKVTDVYMSNFTSTELQRAQEYAQGQIEVDRALNDSNAYTSQDQYGNYVLQSNGQYTDANGQIHQFQGMYDPNQFDVIQNLDVLTQPSIDLTMGIEVDRLTRTFVSSPSAISLPAVPSGWTLEDDTAQVQNEIDNDLALYP